MPSQPQATQNESHVFFPGSVTRNLVTAAAIAKMVYEKKKRYFLCVPLRNIRMAIQHCRKGGASHSIVLSHIWMRPDYSSRPDPAKLLKRSVPISPNKPEEACRMEEGLLPLQTTIRMQLTIQGLTIDERGSFSRSFPSPGRHVFFCGAECLNFGCFV